MKLGHFFSRKNAPINGLAIIVLVSAFVYGLGLFLAFQQILTLPAGLFAVSLAAVTTIGIYYLGLLGNSALVRGIVWQFMGWIVGAFVLTGIRVLMGMDAFDMTKFFFTEPAWVFGGLVGAISFVAGSGAMTDWFKWALGEETPEHREDSPGWEKYSNVSLDHQVIAVQYTVTALFLTSVA